MKSQQKLHKEALLILIGTAIYALGIHVFISPNQIAPGGMTGVSIIVSHLTHLSVGTIYLIVNIPILVLGYLKLGKAFVLKTVAAVALTTVFLDFVYVALPMYLGNKLLACIYGGILIGIGLGMNFLAGGSTGGTDVVNRVIQQKLPHVKIGTLVFVTDAVIIVIATLIFRTIDTALYALVSMFATTVVLDNLLYGLHRAKLLIIISEQEQKIALRIATDLERSCTILKGIGGYTRQEKNAIMCAVRPNQYFKLKRTIYEIDPKAFIIIADSKEVIGEGFATSV